MDRTKGACYFECLDPKAADANQNIRMTQVYPRYLCPVVPFGLFNCAPTKSTARNPAYACDGIGATAVLKYLIPHPIHVLPHDLQGVARAVVGSHGVRAVSEDRHGDDLRAACVPEPVLHPVAQGLHRQLPVGDHLAEALSMLPSRTYLKREAPPGLYR